ncbi:MAG: hypothetical protein IIA92_13540 [Chloroflexi bacterium]|nr:hypothetical protein [Chloroflexota bacterium]
MITRGSRKRFGLIAVCLAFFVVGIVACGSSATPVEVEPTLAPGDPTVYAERNPANSRLLTVIAELPLSFKEEGVWFADYFQARESAGAPQPASLTEFLALSESEREAYQAANRGLVQGPSLLADIRGDIREWDQSLGFSNFSVAVAVSTGEISFWFPPTEAAYMTLEYDQERLRQGLLDMGYVEGSKNGVTYYDAPRSTLESTRSDPLSFIAYMSMNRVVLGEGTLAVSGVQLIDLLPSFPGVAQGEVPSLGDDVAFSELAASLRNPLSAVLLTRSMVLEPEVAKPPRYEKPGEWGDLHQWEALGMGYGITEGAPWMALSLFYPDPDAAKADAGELTLRMSDYDSALRLTHPELREEQLAAMLKRPLDAICGALNTGYRSDENGSTLTIRCNMKDEFGRNVWWSVLLNMRDLGFLLP